MSENQPSNAEILRELRQINNELDQLKEGQTALQTKVEKIETAFYGTGNPHGGLFQQFAALTAKVDGVEKTLEKMFSFAKWIGGIAVVLICAVVVPILLEVILPIIQKWIGN